MKIQDAAIQEHRLAGLATNLRRRNSQLALASVNGRLEVRKTYHSEYSVTDELAAYERLVGVCQAVNGLRLPEVFGLDPSGDAIRIEYIPGRDLRRLIQAEGFGALRAHDTALLDLFVRARDLQVHFDSDPANFLICPDHQELVLIDPVCRPLDLPDFVFVVFLFGLFKASLANPSRLRILQYRAVLKRYCGEYCEQSGTKPTEICRELWDYTAQVIRWNTGAVATESITTRWGRQLAWVPLLRLFQIWLRKQAKWFESVGDSTQ